MGKVLLLVVVSSHVWQNVQKILVRQMIMCNMDVIESSAVLMLARFGLLECLGKIVFGSAIVHGLIVTLQLCGILSTCVNHATGVILIPVAHILHVPSVKLDVYFMMIISENKLGFPKKKKGFQKKKKKKKKKKKS